MFKKFVACVSLFAVFLSVCVFTSNAEDYKVIWTEENFKQIRTTDGWEYNICYKWDEFEVISDEIESIKVIGYKGKKSEITIPTEYDGFAITGIESFVCSDSVKIIRIPKEINSIYFEDENGSHLTYPEALFDAINLQKFVVSKANKNFKSVSGVLYTKNGDSLISYPSAKKGRSFTIPSKVKLIYQGAFNEVKYLKNLTISENVTSIGERAFSSNIKKIYYKNIKLNRDHLDYREWGVHEGLTETVYVFKNSGAHDYYSKMNSKNTTYKKLKFLSKPTKPERTEIKKIRRTSKGIKITLKDIKCSYQKVYRYSSKTKEYEYIGTTKTKTFYDTTAKHNKTYKYKARACNKKNLIKANGRYSKAITIKKK